MHVLHKSFFHSFLLSGVGVVVANHRSFSKNDFVRNNQEAGQSTNAYSFGTRYFFLSFSNQPDVARLLRTTHRRTNCGCAHCRTDEKRNKVCCRRNESQRRKQVLLKINYPSTFEHVTFYPVRRKSPAPVRQPEVAVSHKTWGAQHNLRSSEPKLYKDAVLVRASWKFLTKIAMS